MFIAMNRFQVVPEKAEQFERIWRERETHLDGVPGFVRFALLRNGGGHGTPPNPGEYVSHSTWASREAFMAWTQSEAFGKGHAQGSLMGILEGPPTVTLYDTVLEQDAQS